MDWNEGERNEVERTRGDVNGMDRTGQDGKQKGKDRFYMVEKLSINEKSAATVRLEEELPKVAPLGIITYEELEKIAGEDVRYKACLYTARKNLLGRGIKFGAVQGIGLKRLDGPTIADNAHDNVRRRRKAHERDLAELQCIRDDEYAKFPPEKKATVDSARLIHGASIACAKSEKRFAQRALQCGATPPIPEAWRIMLESNGKEGGKEK